ncbi:hypothetical protein BgiMline_031219, partial [Biomphalaria glabrata]
MESFCEAMGMDSMSRKTYNAHLKYIGNKNEAFIDHIRLKSIQKIRQFYGTKSNEDTVDLT